MHLHRIPIATTTNIPRQLISNCTLNFNLAPDKSSLTRTTSSLATLSSARQLRLQSLQSDLKALSRQLTTLESQHRITTQNHNPAEHASDILRLDTEKFRVAKQASDLEIESQRLEAQLHALNAQLDTLDAQGPEGAAERDVLDDEVVLKLKVYRSLGIEVEGNGEGGRYEKAVIRSRDKGDVHVVNVDQKFGRKFYADYFWGMM